MAVGEMRVAVFLALLVALAPRPSTPADNNLNPISAQADNNLSPTENVNEADTDTDDEAALSLINDIIFSQGYERDCVHRVVSVDKVLQMLRQVSEELALLREGHTTVQANQASLQNSLSVLQHSQAIFVENMSTLQRWYLMLQEKLEKQQLFQQTLSCGECTATLNQNVASLQKKQASLDQNLTIIQEENTILQQNHAFLGEIVAALEHNHTDFLERQAEQTAVLEEEIDTIKANLASVQNMFVWMETNLTQLQTGQDKIFVHDGQKFYVHTASKLDWHAARQWCQTNWNGDLAQPIGDLDRFMKEVAARVKKTPPTTWQHVWFGVSDLQQEGQWVTLDGTNLNDGIPWGPRQPDNKGGIEHCLGVVCNIDKKSFMNDEACTRSHYFVCGQSE